MKNSIPKEFFTLIHKSIEDGFGCNVFLQEISIDKDEVIIFVYPLDMPMRYRLIYDRDNSDEADFFEPFNGDLSMDDFFKQQGDLARKLWAGDLKEWPLSRKQLERRENSER